MALDGWTRLCVTKSLSENLLCGPSASEQVVSKAREAALSRYGDAAQRRAQPAQPREAQMRFSDRL